jgi:hypothetical protein
MELETIVKNPLKYLPYVSDLLCSIYFNEIKKHSQKYLMEILHASLNYTFSAVVVREILLFPDKFKSNFPCVF